jgi:hypothetical protein
MLAQLLVAAHHVNPGNKVKHLPQLSWVAQQLGVWTHFFWAAQKA